MANKGSCANGMRHTKPMCPNDSHRLQMANPPVNVSLPLEIMMTFWKEQRCDVAQQTLQQCVLSHPFHADVSSALLLPHCQTRIQPYNAH